MFGNLTPVTRNIIILNVLVYLASNFLLGGQLYNLLSGYYPFSPNFRIWQIVTHMFMHAPLEGGGGIMHILFNMFTLYSFGPVLERTLGEKKYIIMYFVCGIAGFILFNIWNFYEANRLIHAVQQAGINPAEVFLKSANGYRGDLSVFNNPAALQLGQLLNVKMMGASGAIFGVVAAFAALFPDAKMMIMFIPFPIKAKYLLPVVLVVSVYLGITGSGGGVAHLAHVGGALAGLLFAWYWKKNQPMHQL